MNMKQGDVFILDTDEMALLLQAKGISHFQGFPLERIPGNREEVLLAAKKLSDKGFLNSDGSVFRADAEVSACISLLEKPTGLWVVTPEWEGAPQSFLYVGAKILVCQLSALKKGAVKLWRMEWAEIHAFPVQLGRRTTWEYYPWGQEKTAGSFRLTYMENQMLEAESPTEIREFPSKELGDFFKKIMFNRQEIN